MISKTYSPIERSCLLLNKQDKVITLEPNNDPIPRIKNNFSYLFFSLFMYIVYIFFIIKLIKLNKYLSNEYTIC